ncbi:hypothetical protein HYY75_08250 [bacterium]|nr:hypothetical protein [bacterium]
MKKLKKTGMSIVEIMIVAALASGVFLVAMNLMNSTTRSFKKGSDLLNTQVLMESIVEQLRGDIRNLISIDWDKFEKEGLLSFQATKKKASGGLENVTISYSLKEETLGKKKGKTLIRREGNDLTNFHGVGQVEKMVLKPLRKKSSTDFHCVIIFLTIFSDEKGEGSASKLSFGGRFFSKFLE